MGTKLWKTFSFVEYHWRCKDSGLVWHTDTFMCENNLDCTKCVGVSTEGGRSISGCYGGLQALVRSKASEALWTHRIIHREGLESKHLSPARNLIVESVLKVENFIVTRPQKARSLKHPCEDMESDHSSLLCNCNSQWLSRGDGLTRNCTLTRISKIKNMRLLKMLLIFCQN